MSDQPAPARRLGAGDAVVVGLSAMVGVGVFVAFAPAVEAAGAGLLAGLAVAAVVACCNAVSSAQLAMARERDLPRWLTSVHPVHRVPAHAQVG